MDKIDKLEKLDISYMGPIFKDYRTKADRTQEEVAEKVGITARFLIHVKNRSTRWIICRHVQKPLSVCSM